MNEGGGEGRKKLWIWGQGFIYIYNDNEKAGAWGS